ncbi:MAG: 1-acyl-sn-glycerol-3-phosphate acyltransferase [Desulfamplus sp.]|nr:1-acyl-sn-glycerol-3-phosphate acyltransferase [Desulfamplus sp.]
MSTPAKGIITVLMNLVTVPLIIIWTLLGVVIFPFGFLFMRLILKNSTAAATRRCIWIYGRVWQRITGLFVSFIPPEINGRPFDTPGIIVVNHRSFFDTYCMNMLPVSDVCFAVRAWPFKIPLYNIFMKLAGYINIERDSWEKALSISTENLKNGSFILFFPEGHRNCDGQMLRFYSGAFKMAIENHVPVIPICLTGTESLLPPGRWFLKPAKIRMQILEPVFPDDFQGETAHIMLKKDVKAKMAQCLVQMTKNK